MALTKLSTDVIDLSSNAEALTIPKGTTASAVDVEYLVVAGGGGGGYAYAGGGGAGGYLTNFGATKIGLTIAAAYTITVGDGGAGGIQSSSTLPINGENSVFSGGSGFTASGGGTGGNDGTDNATGGGSGGGASRNNPNAGVGPSPYAQAGGANGTPSSQGNIGGEAYYPTPNSYGWFSGGGGGAGGAGENGKDTSYANGGAGGIGLQNNIDGNNYFYAGGGGGDGTRISSGAIAGGVGGSSIGGTGGHYSTSTESAPTDASPVNRGSGGGGGTNYDDTPVNANGGAGSSGVVILRYPTANPITIGASLTHSSITIDSDTITTFTAGSDTISFAGTGTGRPSSPTEGLMRENTTTGKMEFYDGSLWQEITDTASTYSSGVIPSANFNTNLYDGDGGTTQAISGVGFESDFTWIKDRDTTESHALFDIVRGANEWLSSDTTAAETTYSGNYGVLSWSSDGFTVGNGTAVNRLNDKYVSWNWKAGGTATTINAGTVSNDVASDVSANTATGFSIVKYTGTLVAAGNIDVAHGLGAAPEMIISKKYDGVMPWRVRPFFLNSNPYNYLELNTTNAIASLNVSDGTMAMPTSTVFSNNWNGSIGGTGDIIAYCWRSIPGYSKIGFYVGNGSVTGPEIYTGFKPAWLLIRRYDSGDNWLVFDNKRNTSNPRNLALVPNNDAAESVGNLGQGFSFVSTGFQVASSDSGVNASEGKFIYMTFAE